HLVVLDPTLLGKEVVSGLEPGGTLLINTREDIEAFDGRFSEYRLATVDATKIARHHQIGTRSVVIVNTTIAGAFARLHDIPLDVLGETYSSLGLESNFDAAREAAEAVVIRPTTNDHSPTAASTTAPEAAGDAPTHTDVRPIEEHLESQPSGLRTGSWSTQMPHYIERLAPCSAWCPAGNDVVGFLQAVATDGEAAAAQVLGRSTPLAGVCGRVCPAPCMESCNRTEYDGAVNIRALERWIADHVPVATREVVVASKPRRVAIVGGGPAGLAAAYDLARAGHRAHIFEGENALGGVLRTGIPVYRLPREVIDQEIDAILALGVTAHCGEFVDAARIVAMAQEYDAVILATGLQRLRGLDVSGADLAGIEQGIHFLHDMNMKGIRELSGHVVVLGGGNTAMDCARSALRAGAERVTVAYRRTHVEMPAIKEEIEEAGQEGVVLLFQRQPIGFGGGGKGNGQVASIELAEVELGEPDDSGRRRPVVTDRSSRFDCDHVLLALGQSADLSLLPESWELRDGQIFVEGQPRMVFAAGDLSTGDGTVTHAIGSGRRAAGLALDALGVLDAEAEVFERPDRTQAVPVTDIRLDHFARSKPECEELMPAAARTRNFEVVNHGLASATEAHRCFACGHCTECDTCLVYCPEGIIHRTGPGYEVDYSYCKGCGICVEECPRNAMEMRPK
ncbi:MAG: FAD-dependent oxidoreductase, partial [Planctomycetota bacterium]